MFFYPQTHKNILVVPRIIVEETSQNYCNRSAWLQCHEMTKSFSVKNKPFKKVPVFWCHRKSSNKPLFEIEPFCFNNSTTFQCNFQASILSMPLHPSAYIYHKWPHATSIGGANFTLPVNWIMHAARTHQYAFRHFCAGRTVMDGGITTTRHYMQKVALAGYYGQMMRLQTRWSGDNKCFSSYGLGCCFAAKMGFGINQCPTDSFAAITGWLLWTTHIKTKKFRWRNLNKLSRYVKSTCRVS